VKTVIPQQAQNTNNLKNQQYYRNIIFQMIIFTKAQQYAKHEDYNCITTIQHQNIQKPRREVRYNY
jgi:hypothetical protein